MATMFSDVGPDVRWVGNEKGVAFETDVHECGLHPRKDLRYLSFIDVADDSLRSMTFDVKLNEFVVLQNRNLCFLGSC